MEHTISLFETLSDSDINNIKADATRQHFKKDSLIFSEGDTGDSFYIIENGSVTVFYDDSGNKVQLRTLGDGDYFGEMGIINKDKRSASVSAIEDSTLFCIDKETFIKLTNNHPMLADKISQIFAQRSEELILRESLLDTTGVQGRNLYVSIKGDPSMRETALFRERYESPVDKILEQLQPNLEDIIINRCAYDLTINFNSGEIHIHSVFDPFKEIIHTADRLVDQAYIERHFAKISYEKKADLIKRMRGFILDEPEFAELALEQKNIFTKSFSQWKPIAKEEIIKVMSKLAGLRKVPDFYLRNFSISMVQDAIRLQFNCDGTHIINSEGYPQFVKQNFEFE